MARAKSPEPRIARRTVIIEASAPGGFIMSGLDLSDFLHQVADHLAEDDGTTGGILTHADRGFVGSYRIKEK
jgi:hypothetical protein